jgi:hypothetical protein
MVARPAKPAITLSRPLTEGEAAALQRVLDAYYDLPQSLLDAREVPFGEDARRELLGYFTRYSVFLSLLGLESIE